MSKHEAFQRHQLEVARADLVRKYRANPSVWPDGIESKADRWYSEHLDKWTDAYVASLLDKPVSSTPVDIPPLVDTLVDKCPPEDILVDKLVDMSTAKVVRDTAYWRERKRAQRAKLRGLTPASSAA